MSVTLDAVVKRYVAPDGGVVPVIDVPAFGLSAGEQVAMIGASGSGKTTLLHMIAGILTPDSGRILFTPRHEQAVDVAVLSEASRDVFRGQNIGYIFQTHHLLGGLTALENVLMGMSFTGRSADPAWARQLLNEVGLSQRMDYLPSRLSVGQQQRVAVARALANRPQLVLADEPTGALDSVNAQQVLELIRKLCTEVGASLLLVTHDLDIAAQFARTVRLDEINHAGK